MEVAWSSILDVDSYSIRILQKDMDRIPEILKAVPKAKIAQMQANIAKVWRRWDAPAALGPAARPRVLPAFRYGTGQRDIGLAGQSTRRP